ncbi:hypothetical protein [Paenibacillus crassostreae]|uniref:Glycosyltransferase 2-like domain-containing protein n=1 Tax=Paenibacillus crassostreae TaxID=1763538 RepID=A0A167EG56_9BACL|nr:hypothetical protein [Paenibacillus crassostreae]AOZ92612.1 hypothetical protein LPB68_10525 [Paenibacillus crassostreae]OAB75519.1 hypothetical protein PNBC_08470 [Paenibacillus crassostreae]
MRISRTLDGHGQQLVLGSRHFTGNVPFRSRLGNSITRMVYSFTTGIKVYDTQTGLRGYSADLLNWLCQIPGERFEYEMNMLLRAQNEGYIIHEIFIDTVYLEHNKSSHFRPLADSFKIYLPLLLFSGSSIISGVNGLLHVYHEEIGIPLFIAKLLTEGSIFLFSYWAQRKYVYKA